ncbi:hypothetical protein PRIC2_004691 [Phytophthora ramorum]
MRLHYILLVAAATLLASTNVTSASPDSAQIKLSTTATGTIPAFRSLAGASNEVGGKMSLRAAKEDEADDEADEERGITVFSSETSAKKLRGFLKKNSIIGKETSKFLKSSGFSADEIATMYAKYVKLT